MENFNLEEYSRELESLKDLQICLSGYEANALIVAVQLVRASSLMECNDIASILNCAEVAALKLQKLFVSCPTCLSTMERGWQLSRSENFLPEDFPLETFNS